MNLTLVVLAAGLSGRYGAVKQLESVGPSDEALLDYAIYDAIRSGFTKIVLVVRPELEDDFRIHMRQLLGDAHAVAFVFQQLDSLPPGYDVPQNRTKPWGTGHAILASEPEVAGPFAVSNADDFYGNSAYALLHDHLVRAGDQLPTFALVGYTLVDTPLSTVGGVSRAICHCDDQGFLESIVEIQEIRAKGNQMTGVTAAGEAYELFGDETASMNLWGLTPAIFPILQKQFAEFMLGADCDDEFLISTAMNEQVATGQVRVKILPAREQGFGMTHRADKDQVVARIRELVAQGRYPADLPAWFGTQRHRDPSLRSG